MGLCLPANLTLRTDWTQALREDAADRAFKATVSERSANRFCIHFRRIDDGDLKTIKSLFPQPGQKGKALFIEISGPDQCVSRNFHDNGFQTALLPSSAQ